MGRSSHRYQEPTPKGCLRAIERQGVKLVFDVPRTVTSRHEIETQHVPLWVKEPGRRWRPWDALMASVPKYSPKRLDKVKVVEDEGTAPESSRVCFVVPAKTWRDLVPGVTREEVTRIAGPTLLIDEDADVATVGWGPVARDSIAADRLRDLFGKAGVRVEEREDT